MPKPSTKSELIKAAEERYQELNALIRSYSPEQRKQAFPPGTLNRNIRDVLTHLHHWHILFIQWYGPGMKGEKPEMPAEGYTWQTLPQLNKKIHQQYCDFTLRKAQSRLKKSHNEIMSIINKHTEEELFQKKRYPWTGSTSLGAYLISCTWSHYHWAMKLIKKGLKN